MYSNRYTGLFANFGPVPRRPHDPDVFVYGGTVIPWGARSQPLAVGGAGWTEDAALASALGEAVERLQPYPLTQDRFIESSFALWPLDECAIDPEKWVLFLAEQYSQPEFPFRPLMRDTVCRWICFRHVCSGEPVWIPEEFAFLYPAPGKAHVICPGVSSGLSCARTPEEALMRGVQEVIERDALVGAWWGNYSLQEWAPAAIASLAGESFLERIRRPNLKYRFYRVATPFSAHVTIVTLDGMDHEGFCFSVGSACRETRRESWVKSLLEAIHGRYYVRYLRSLGVEAPLLPVDFQQHALYYSIHLSRLSATVFATPLLDSCRQDSVPADTEQNRTEGIAPVLERLGPGHPPLFRNMTPPGIAQEFRDWHVVKVVIPGLQPLHGNHHLPHLAGKLWPPRTFADWRRMLPHPFA